MYLSQCKSCSHHICIMNDFVLCGYTIDREERKIKKDATGLQVVTACPKEAQNKTVESA